MITECSDGTYGYNCVNKCSGHCLNDSSCNKQTGQCDGGCKPGYKDADCRKSKYIDNFVKKKNPSNWFALFTNIHSLITFES